MWLISTYDLELQGFLGDSTPRYAILSHTWETDEVSYHQWRNRDDSIRKKAGALKIEAASRKAREDGLDWLWVDTNCIDKSSSSELSEAINSMFAWYRDSTVCYAYLQDIPSAQGDRSDCLSAFKKSRWFTRGWTLQELLAPTTMIFYARDWSVIGTGQSLQQIIHEATGIDLMYLHGKYLREVQRPSVAKIMSWVARRRTTRPEDIAYCTLGLFDVNMPLLYGEGSKAFIRLQHEIIRFSSDHTIFCWTWNNNVPDNWTSMLAPSPDVYLESGDVEQTSAFSDIKPYSMTNLGLSIELPV
ncbi:hypothetical protein M426DRAFT_67076, partial [Hypoxylon sp. CI-4A]